jgi:hypothetical protein
MSILSKASLLNCVGEVPVLIISEQPSRPESDDRITYLNFPFDMDDLNITVVEILEKRSGSDLEREKKCSVCPVRRAECGYRHNPIFLMGVSRAKVASMGVGSIVFCQTLIWIS